MAITAGCRRRTIDIPFDMDEMIKTRAATPPAISVSEYIRRVMANHLNYDLPPAIERNKTRTRLDGQKKEKPGPKHGE